MKREEHLKGEGTMETIIILLVALLLFDVAAFLWGCDSRDSVDSAEWEKREYRQAFY
jgi:hypothetical protein